MARKYYDENGNVVKKRGGCLKWFGIALIALIIIGAIVSLSGGEETNDEKASEIVSSQESEQAEEIASENEESQESESSESSESSEETDVPREYTNALKSAQNYVDIMAFSEAKLYEQLISEYGEQYPEEAAQYAIDNVEVDYNEEALQSAKNYQETMPMSDDGLYDQLTSEYGELFTAEQAQYAIDNLE